MLKQMPEYRQTSIEIQRIPSDVNKTLTLSFTTALIYIGMLLPNQMVHYVSQGLAPVH